MSLVSSAPLAQRVLRRLSDGEFHSGEALAAELDVTRAAIWKAVEQLRELGVEPEAQPNKGYRLPPGVDALDEAVINAELSHSVRSAIERLEVAWCVESTNDSLLAEPHVAPDRARVLLAEQQTAGRGRRGRAWLAPPGGAICLSIGWSFADMPRDLSALTLAIGVCAQRALAACGAAGVLLKWPNDLVTTTAKVGGILLELRAEASGPAYVVVGIGINIALPAATRDAIVAAGGVPVDLRSLATAPIGRNALVAQLINECVVGLRTFRDSGFSAFHREWNSLDALRSREVTLLQGGERIRGVARGVDAHGQLLLEVAGHVTAHASGEVSVRLAEPDSHRFD